MSCEKHKKEVAGISFKELELLKRVTWMGVLWARSLIDAEIPIGKKELHAANKAYQLIAKKIKPFMDKTKPHE